MEAILAANSDILRRLERIQATLQLAFAPQLQKVREAIRQDPIDAAILDATQDWIGSTELQADVAKKTGKTTRAIRGHLPALVARGILEAGGSEGRPKYRQTGLI